jgi:hypothetical protein
MIRRIIVTMLACGLLGGVVGFNLGGWAAPTRESEAARIRDMVQRDPIAALNQVASESQEGEGGKTFAEIAMDYRKRGAFVGGPIGLMAGLALGLVRGKPQRAVSPDRSHA